MNLAEYDSNRQLADTKSGPVGYIDVGSGRPALFVHGVGTSGLLWRNVVGALKDERRCIAPDLRLHGRTPVRRHLLPPALRALATRHRSRRHRGGDHRRRPVVLPRRARRRPGTPPARPLGRARCCLTGGTVGRELSCWLAPHCAA